jgi:murein DD-endopeptidase MepM/ murein hydrolase activator NlpD
MPWAQSRSSRCGLRQLDSGSQGSSSSRNLRSITSLVSVVGGAGLILVGLLPSTATAGTVSSDQVQIAQIQQRIESQGAAVQRLVEAYDAEISKEAEIRAQLDQARAQLAADRLAQGAALARLRHLALVAYVTDESGASMLSMFDSFNATSLLTRQTYMGVASGNLRSAIDSVEISEQKTQGAETVLSTEEVQAQGIAQQLTAERDTAQAALSQDNALLDGVQRDLQSALAAEAIRRAAAERAAEQAMAEQEAAAAAAAAARPVPVSIDPTPGSYANPLRSISALVPERIDQGVDYHGFGPILAVGDGVVLNTVNSGWPGGTFITYKLTDGGANGLVAYAAEDIVPLVSVGEKVTPNTILGTMYEGPDGIETGWADPSGDGYTMAHDYGQFSGANSTAFGANFSRLLASLGAPSGILQNNPPTGSLPPNWPTW